MTIPSFGRDPAQARQHIQHLKDTYGISNEGVASLAGVSLGMVAGILYPHCAQGRIWLFPRVEEAILEARFDLDRLPPTFQVSACGSRRRLQALQRQGWALSMLLREVPVALDTLVRVYRVERVHVALARDVRRVYSALADRPGPSQIARSRATSRGWLPPVAWDDDEMDMVTAQPHHNDPDYGLIDEVAVDRLVGGGRVRATKAEEVEAARRLLAQGATVEFAAERLRRSERTLERWRVQYGLREATAS
jgi:hypothetical protein